MVIYNWLGVINEQLTKEYKSGNARELKVTYRNYALFIPLIGNSVCLLGRRHLVREVRPLLPLSGFALAHHEETELENCRGDRARLHGIRNANCQDFPRRTVWMRNGGCRHRRLDQTGSKG